MALLIAVVGMVVVLGAVGLAIATSGQASHDERTRGAQQAADAGVQQQLYLQSDSNGVGYNVTSGSIGSLLDCVLPALNVSGQISGVTLVADTAGSCPQPTCPSGGANCTSGVSSAWTPLGAQDYYESRYLANPHLQGSSVAGDSSYEVEFPEILSIGCHSATATCGTVSGANSYSRQLMVLDPTAPLQSIEAQNNATITGGASALSSAFSLLGLGGLCSILNILCPTLPITAVAGNVTAGNNITLPTVTVGGNLNLASYLSLSGLTTLVTNLNNLGATFQYGTNTGGTCTQDGDTCGQTTPNTAALLNANVVHATDGTCTAGQPPSSGACTLDRPTFSISAAPTSATSGVPSGGTCTSCTISDTNGDLVMSAGTLNLAGGTYVFCNVNVTGGTFEGPKAGTTGAVQIFVLPYGSSQCPTPSGNNQGNFTVTPGISNLLSSTSLLPLDGVSNVVDPSGFQVYVSGDVADNSMAVGGSSTPHTSVTIGGSGISVEQAMVVYAPRSTVNISTTGIFEGSAIGWNVNLEAAAIIEDLDLGNYALSSVINALQPAQTVECNSDEDQTLSYTSTDLTGC
jgi:hypothetical protein